jgi:archaellum component FlaC
MISQAVCLELNEKTMKSANDILSKLVFRNQKNKTSIKDLSRKVDDFVNRPPSPISSCKSEPSFHSDELNSLNEKIEKVSKRIETVEAEFNKSLQDLDFLTQKAMKKIENGLKIWTKEEIAKDIDFYMGDAKKKLEWIPNGSESMKGMTVTEARIFLLESRIRQEENSRILSIQNLEQEIKSWNRPRSVGLHKKSKTSCTPVEEKIMSFQKVKVVSKRPSSSLGYREINAPINTGLREKFRIKVNDLTL